MSLSNEEFMQALLDSFQYVQTNQEAILYQAEVNGHVLSALLVVLVGAVLYHLFWGRR